MPNEANKSDKSNDKSGNVQKKRKPTMPAVDKQATEGSAAKDDNGNAQKGDAGSAAKKKSKTASGDGGNE